MDHVVGTDHQGDVHGGELVVDLIEVVDQVIGNTGFGQQNVHVPGHTPCHRMDREVDVDTLSPGAVGTSPGSCAGPGPLPCRNRGSMI